MSQRGDADLVLTGGAVYTVDAARSWADTVAVRNGKIAAVGSDLDVRELIGPRTTVIDLHGRMALPGFQDAHVHASAAGLERIRCDLSESHSLEEYLELIGGYADRHPEAAWITGGGWAMDVFPGGVPSREALDRVVPDRPVYLSNRDHHAVWVNTRALELAGVTAETPDPPDGRVERDRSGAPIGTLQEGAMDLVRPFVPEPTPREKRQGILEAQRYLHSLGVTAWQEAIVGGYAVIPDCFDAYRDLTDRGELTGRVVGALWWQRGRGEDQIEELIERRDRAGADRFRATSVKIMQDGVLENFTGAMLDPYLDVGGNPTDARGTSYFEPEELKSFLTRIDAAGFQVHIHAIGDRAVREALDAFEVARAANGVRDARHTIAHLQVVHPDDVPRFAALDVIPNAQPFWACLEPQMVELNLPVLGGERSRRQYPFASLLRAGARLAFGSDWTVSTADPLEEMAVGVTRQVPGEPDTDVFLPDERLTRTQAVEAFTRGSSRVTRLDADTGVVEPGRLADLAVVDRDILAPDSGSVADARVVLTMVGGDVVHAAP